MEVDTPTPSLLERIGEPRRGSGSRSTTARRQSAPYQKRRDALGSSNADADMVWKHDKHEGSGGSLAARLQGGGATRPRPDLSVVQSVLRDMAPSSRGLSIKGAGQPAEPIVEVKGLVAGTTAEDVRAIFQSCGPIAKARLSNTSTEQSPHVLLYYEKREHALSAVNKFNGLPADGQKLSVVLAPQNLSIQERVLSGKNVDILLGDQPSGKMYSDALVASDPRAQVVMGDFTVDEPAPIRGRGGRGRRGRGGSRRGDRGNATRMDLDH